MDNVEYLLTDPKVAKALAHPLRVKLLKLLDRREASPSELSEELGAALGNVSYHVRTLHDLGFLKLVGEKRQRGAVEHYYTAVKWVIHEDAWKALPGPVRRAVDQSALSYIGEEAYAAAASGGFEEPYAQLDRDVLVLDDEAARQLAKEVSGLMQRALALEAECKERLEASAGGDPKRVNLVLMLFGSPKQERDGDGSS
jgi:DNA-binding transcriptional ArsR family regulator